jgi:SAM-dependent methyltransferase
LLNVDYWELKLIRALSWLAVLRRRIAVALAWRLRRETPRTGPLGLKRRLIAEGKTRWLDIGNGDKFEDGFHYLDWFPHDPPDPETAARCFRGDILRMPDEEMRQMGLFDLVRMQHVFEHFSYEEGPEVLRRCARLLNPGGWLLLTVPDLRFFARAYFCDGFGVAKNFMAFARGRIPADAPASAYFSMFAHSFGYGPEGAAGEHLRRDLHKWCYDAEGVAHQLQRAGGFHDLRRIGLLHPLAAIPFTHNKPEQDVCLVARRTSS